jgi:hypothetical protein
MHRQDGEASCRRRDSRSPGCPRRPKQRRSARSGLRFRRGGLLSCAAGSKRRGGPPRSWSRLPFDDLVQEGAVGLVRAVERQREVVVRRYASGGDVAQSHEAIGAWLGVGEERSRRIERHALYWLRAMAGPVARGGLARGAAQMSHEHHPARAANRDGNEGQREGEGRAGRQTLPEHGVPPRGPDRGASVAVVQSRPSEVRPS